MAFFIPTMSQTLYKITYRKALSCLQNFSIRPKTGMFPLTCRKKLRSLSRKIVFFFFFFIHLYVDGRVNGFLGLIFNNIIITRKPTEIMKGEKEQNYSIILLFRHVY